MKQIISTVAVVFFSFTTLCHAKNNFDFSTFLTSGFAKTVFNADINGDGILDIIEYNSSNGKIKVGISSGNFNYTNGISNLTYTYTTWATVAPIAGWTFQTGDFTGDGKIDILGYYPSADGDPNSASIWVGTNTGSNFNFTLWATVYPAANWKFFSGDFNNDGTLDIAGYQPSYLGDPNTGSLWTGINTGVAFSFSKWATFAPATNWQFYHGDFTNDGIPDFAAFQPATGAVQLFKNNLVSFKENNWATLPISVAGWFFYPGKFNKDTRLDLMGYNSSTGNITLCKNNKSNFVTENWYTVNPAGGWKFTAGDFSGDGKTDMLGYFATNASLWLGFNYDNQFKFNQWDYSSGLVNSTNWQIQAGDFNNDNRLDILCNNEVSGLRKLGINAPHAEGYCWPLSAKPGESIQFSISGNGAHNLEIQKYISYDTHVTATTMLSLPNINYRAQYIPETAWRDGCGWDTAYSLTIPADWISGYYALKLTDVYGNVDYVTFIVKPTKPSATKIAVIANVNTWQAYNSWDGSVYDATGDYEHGHGKYTPANFSTFSFLRPNPSAHPVITPTLGFTEQHLVRGELWVYTWLLNQGYFPDVYTDIDLDADGIKNSYKYLILHTHPEYWTTEMYDKTNSFLHNGNGVSGGNLISIGGNSIFEVCTYNFSAPVNKQIVFYNGVDGSKRDSFLFRNERNVLLAGQPRPEKNLIGIHTVGCNVGGQSYAINPAIFGTSFYKTIFRDVESNNFGQLSYCDGNGTYAQGAAGWEIDGTSDLNCGDFTPAIPINPNLKVLASATNGSQIIYIPSSVIAPTHGFVFSAGSITFGGGLAQDPHIEQMMRNVLDHGGRLFKQPDYTSSKYLTNLDEVKLAPNPVKQLFTITSAKNKISKIIISDVSGKVVWLKDFYINKQSIVTVLRPTRIINGVYFEKIYFENENNFLVKKVLFE